MPFGRVLRVVTSAMFWAACAAFSPTHSFAQDASVPAPAAPRSMLAVSPSPQASSAFSGVAPANPDAAEPVPVLVHQPTFTAAGLLERDRTQIRLAGVQVTAADALCGSDAWPCGRMAKAALQRFVRRRALECRLPPGTPSETTASCKVGGKDLGEWLVAQGWAKAEGGAYGEAENLARQGERGLWSPLRPGAGRQHFEVGTTLTDAPVRIEVRLASQSLTLIHRGQTVGQWPVSTARDGKVTPTGKWTAKWLSRDHRSSRYNDAPMPYAVFYNGDYAVHGTYETGRLGRPASAGCVRLEPKHAATLFNLVREEGLDNTLIIIR